MSVSLYVNPSTGHNSNPGQPESPLKSLSAALARSTSKTTIYLAPGRYTVASGESFPLVIPSEVTVLGNESTKGTGILVEGSGIYGSQIWGNQIVTFVLGNNAQLRGITITNRTNQGVGVWIESGHSTIANCSLMACAREGIFVTGMAKPQILDNVLGQSAASGISFSRNGKGEARRNQIEQGGTGILVTDEAAPLLTDNRISAAQIGMNILRNARPVLRRNLMTKNFQAGCVVNDQAQPDLGKAQDPAGNIFRDNGGSDLRNLTSARLVSSGNQINPARVQGNVDFVATKAETGSFLQGPTQFKDLGGHWAEIFIQALVQRGALSGFPDRTFRPDSSLTRAQYAAAIAKTFDLPTKKTVPTFLDVPNSFWGASAIQKASAMGFISGFPDQTFRPNQNLTRVQALVSLMSGLGLTGGNAGVLSVYRDRALIPSYATTAIATATFRQMVVNYPDVGLLEPMRDTTRGEVAAFIYQALVTLQQATAVSSPYIVSSAPTVVSTFSDIAGHWASDYIQTLATQSLITGYTDGSFKPNETLTRAAFAALVVKAFNPTIKRPATQFSDIAANFWASGVIQQAYQGGFLSGFPDQTFRPQDPVSRLQILLALVNGLNLLPGNEGTLEIYQDRESIPAYARAAIASATEQNLILNYPHPNQLNPNQPATRADAAVFVHQALVAIGRIVESLT